MFRSGTSVCGGRDMRPKLPQQFVPIPAASSSARCPSDSHPCCRPGERPDGTESRPRRDSSHRRGPLRERRSAGQYPWQPGCKNVLPRMESIADTPTRVAERRSRECRAAMTRPRSLPRMCRSSALDPRLQSAFIRLARGKGKLALQPLHQFAIGASQTESSRCRARSQRSASVPAASRRTYNESLRQSLPAGICRASCPAATRSFRKAGCWSRIPRRTWRA